MYNSSRAGFTGGGGGGSVGGGGIGGSEGGASIKFETGYFGGLLAIPQSRLFLLIYASGRRRVQAMTAVAGSVLGMHHSRVNICTAKSMEITTLLWNGQNAYLDPSEAADERSHAPRGERNAAGGGSGRHSVCRICLFQ